MGTSWTKENWFKLGIVAGVLLVGIAFLYSQIIEPYFSRKKFDECLAQHTGLGVKYLGRGLTEREKEDREECFKMYPAK